VFPPSNTGNFAERGGDAWCAHLGDLKARDRASIVPAVTTVERWWEGDLSERYWLEVSDRGDGLGVDLDAPTTNEVGGSFWSYDLLREVSDGDVVLHADRGEHPIVGWSWAVGTAWPDNVVWAARGTFARGRNIQPHERPGMRVSLRGPFGLLVPLTLDRIRAEQTRLELIRAGRPYFPFELGGRATRPLQGYLFKLPAAFVGLFDELEGVPRLPEGVEGLARNRGGGSVLIEKPGTDATPYEHVRAFLTRSRQLEAGTARDSM
jgi:hypothetical protein